MLHRLLEPFQVNGLELRNRIVSTSHAPGYAEDGLPGERYQRYHEEKARGGVGLTMFGGSSIVSPEVSPVYRQIDVSNDRVIPVFREFAERIHRHGTKLMCQISHMGRRTAWDDGDWIVPIAPSSVRDPAHHAVPRSMELDDIARIVTAYGDAADRCAEGHLDGVEIMVSSHLPGQFLAPEANRRLDAYGGALENRMRFLTEVLTEIRRRTPAGFVVSLRMAVDEAWEGGPTADECLAVAQRLWADGLYDLLNLSGVAASTTPGLSELVGSMARPLAPYLDAVREFREQVGAPVLHGSRLPDVSTAAHALESGAVDLVGMARALMADPHLVAKLERSEVERIRPCVGAAYCIDRIYMGREAFCLHNPATGRERWLPHTIEPSTGPRRRVVVVGGGPAGLEAARVAAARGHEVVLFEAAPRLGGQLVLAARAAWRRDLLGIVDWLAAEVARLGVDIRTGTLADADSVLAEQPDVVVIATGGTPRAPGVDGADLAVSSVDVLGGSVTLPSRAVVYDETGGHAAISVAQHLADHGTDVTLVTPDRLAGRDLGGVSWPTYLAALTRRGARIVPDHRLAGVARRGASMEVQLRHEYAPDRSTTIDTDLVVAELGTAPTDDLFHALAERAANRGLVDVWALQAWEPQPAFASPVPDGSFLLLSVGDAVASRDVHAALLDALRVLKDL